MQKKVWVVSLILIASAAAAFYFYTRTHRASVAAAPPALQLPVTRGTLSATVSGSGAVASRAQVSHMFGASGAVKQVYVKLGEAVKKGQILAELDTTELQRSLAIAQVMYNQQVLKYEQTKSGASESEIALARVQAEAAQASYDAAVRKAQLKDAQLRVAQTTLDKVNIALKKTQAEYDKAISARQTDVANLAAALQQAKLDAQAAQANYDLTIAGMDDAALRNAHAALLSAQNNLNKLLAGPSAIELQLVEAQLEQAKLTWQQAQAKMREIQLVAQLDGIVTQLNIDAYSNVSASTAALQVTDLNQLHLSIAVAEVDVAKVKVGQEAQITLDALPQAGTLIGKVEQIAWVGTNANSVVSYAVLVALPTPDTAAVKLGMTANVAIVTEKREQVLIVPNAAIRNVNGQRVVQVPSAVGPVNVPVSIGMQTESQSEILSGLKEGELVLLNLQTPAPGGSDVIGRPFGPSVGGAFIIETR